MAVLAIFVVTTAVFVLYDWYVELRQRVIHATAVKTDAVVKSIFPETVRDRIIEDVAETTQHQEEEQSKSKTRFLVDHVDDDVSADLMTAKDKGFPIAGTFV